MFVKKYISKKFGDQNLFSYFFAYWNKLAQLTLICPNKEIWSQAAKNYPILIFFIFSDSKLKYASNKL